MNIQHKNSSANDLLNRLRPVLKSYAYNICGSVEDSEDIIHDSFIKYLSIDAGRVENPRSFLIRMVINAAINLKKKTIRQQRINQQLVELPGSSPELPDAGIIRKEALSFSLSIILTKLNPRQQAVFILKEAFDYNHEEIAGMLGISSDMSRQHLSRAKKRIWLGDSHADKFVSEERLLRYKLVLQSGDQRLIENLVISDMKGRCSTHNKAIAA